MKEQSRIPTESQEQQALMQWAAYSQGRYPELGALFHIPNEGLRSARTGQRLKAEGMKPGVPDLFLPVARGGFHGLFIELKRVKGGRVSDSQREWIRMLNRNGYDAVVCFGAADAQKTIVHYLEGLEWKT